MVIFQCYVSLPEGTQYACVILPQVSPNPLTANQCGGSSFIFHHFSSQIPLQGLGSWYPQTNRLPLKKAIEIVDLSSYNTLIFHSFCMFLYVCQRVCVSCPMPNPCFPQEFPPESHVSHIEPTIEDFVVSGRWKNMGPEYGARTWCQETHPAYVYYIYIYTYISHKCPQVPNGIYNYIQILDNGI